MVYSMITDLLFSRHPALLAGLTLLLTAAAIRAEPYLTTAEVELFRKHVVAAHLAPGQIVEAAPIEADHAWLLVTWNQQPWEAEAKSLVAASALERNTRTRLAELDRQVQESGRDIDGLLARRAEIAYAIAAARYDSVIVYRNVQQYTYQNGGGAIQPSPSVTFSDKLDPSMAKRMIRDWNEERAKVETALREKLAGRLRGLEDRQRSEIRANAWQQALDRFRQSATGYRQAPYITVREGAELTADKQVAARLPRLTVLPAEPHPNHPGWLRATWKGQICEARAEEFRSRAALEEESRLNQTVTARQLTDLDVEIHFLADLLSRTQAAELAMRAESNLPYTAPGRDPFNRDGPGRALYPVSNLPAGMSEYVNTSRARRVIKDMEADKTALAARFDAARREQIRLTRLQAETAARTEQLLAAFSAPSGAPPPAATPTPTAPLPPP